SVAAGAGVLAQQVGAAQAALPDVHGRRVVGRQCDRRTNGEGWKVQVQRRVRVSRIDGSLWARIEERRGVACGKVIHRHGDVDGLHVHEDGSVLPGLAAVEYLPRETVPADEAGVRNVDEAAVASDGRDLPVLGLVDERSVRAEG